MTLDPQVKKFLDEFYSYDGAPLERIAHMSANQQEDKKIIALSSIEDKVIKGANGDIPIRIYKTNQENNQPAIIYFHGGGFHTGNLETHDDICRHMAYYANYTVISVDYHLAPMYKFPIPVEDAYEATDWVFKHAKELQLDPQRIGVSGDSAGGNLSAVVTHLAKEKQQFSLAFQILLYPSTSLRETVSMKENGYGYMSDRERLNQARELYLRGPEDYYNLLYAPLFFPDFTDLPPALIITAQYDAIRDDGADYAQRLQEANVPVKYTCFEGLIHGFLSLNLNLSQKKDTYVQISEWLKDTIK